MKNLQNRAARKAAVPLLVSTVQGQGRQANSCQMSQKPDWVSQNAGGQQCTAACDHVRPFEMNAEIDGQPVQCRERLEEPGSEPLSLNPPHAPFH